MKVLILFALVVATASAASLLNTLAKPLEQSFELPLEQPLKHPLGQPLQQPLEQPLEEPLLEPAHLKDLIFENNGEKEGRITNGWAASNGQFPYQAGLLLTRHDGASWCGGTLIGHNWVLSAAHCTNGAHTVSVYLGDVRVYGGVSFTVGGGNIHQHPGWNGIKNDIALIQIPAVGYNNVIQAAHLPSENWSYAGWQGIASGWGEIWQGSGVVQELRFTSQRIIENWVCLNSFGSHVVDDGAICVETPRDSSTCFGDSGGPLVLEGTWTVVGVCSFLNYQGCHSGQPAGFMRVGSYRNWIRSISGI